MPSILDEHQSWQDTGGKPLVSGKVFFGDQGSDPVLNPQSIFSDRALTIALSNPQILDSLGRSTNKVWIAGPYSIQVDDLNDVQIFQELDNGTTPDVGVTALDNVSGANTITATAVDTITAYQDLELYTFRTAQANTTAITLNIDGVGAKSVLKNHDEAITTGEWAADQNIVVSFNETDDILQWVNQDDPAAIGWEFLSATTASSSTNVTFTGFDAGFDYMVTVAGLLPVTDSVQGEWELAVSGPIFRTSGYKSAVGGASSGGAAFLGPTAHFPGTIGSHGNAADENSTQAIIIEDPAAATDTYVRIGPAYQSNQVGAVFGYSGGGFHTTAEAMDAIKYAFSSGDISVGFFKFWRRASA